MFWPVIAIVIIADWNGVSSSEENSKITSAVLDWWARLDVQKPVKCETNFPAEFQTDRVSQSFDPMRCYPCPDGEEAVEHSFKGNIQDHIFDGPGMLKFKHDKTAVGWKHDSQTCYTFPKNLSMSDNIAEYAVGTWKNGAMDATVKIGFKDSTIISQVSDGDLHGLSR